MPMLDDTGVLRFDEPQNRPIKYVSQDFDLETGEWVMVFSGEVMQPIMYAILDDFRQKMVGDQHTM